MSIWDLSWYAVEVSTRKEYLAMSALQAKGYECFLPLYQKRRIWKDRVNVSSCPLFPGYLFSRLDLEQCRMPLLVTPGVRRIVGTAKIPTPIPDGEIEAISRALKSGLPLEPCAQLEHGDRVVVTHGPLAGVEGTVIRSRGYDRLVLSVSLIQRAVSVELDRMRVEPVNRRPSPTWHLPQEMHEGSRSGHQKPAQQKAALASIQQRIPGAER